MFERLHNLMGMGSLSNAAQNTLTASTNVGMLGQMAAKQPQYKSKKIFDGRIEVQQVANGYVIHIGVREGYEYTTHIASTITEVNEIIAAQMVAFKLEDKS